MEYFIEIYQPKEFPLIEVLIYLNPCSQGCYLGAQTLPYYDPDDGHVSEMITVISGNIGLPHRPTRKETAEFARWYDLARSAADCLAGLIQSPDDLRRPIWAKIEGDTVVVGFKDA